MILLEAKRIQHYRVTGNVYALVFKVKNPLMRRWIEAMVQQRLLYCNFISQTSTSSGLGGNLLYYSIFVDNRYLDVYDSFLEFIYEIEDYMRERRTRMTYNEWKMTATAVMAEHWRTWPLNRAMSTLMKLLMEIAENSVDIGALGTRILCLQKHELPYITDEERTQVLHELLATWCEADEKIMKELHRRNISFNYPWRKECTT